MKIKMLKAVSGKVNGVHMGPYINGREYSVPDEMPQDHAGLFMGSAMAEAVVAPVPVEVATEPMPVEAV